MMAITITTAKIPTTAPALNIPVITEHPLSDIITKANSKRFNFFIGLNCKIVVSNNTTITPFFIHVY
jgi:hypothetical protein